MGRHSYEKHGATKTRTYRIWTCMIYRCSNPNVTSYHKYGGRGIDVCSRWRESFQCFLEDMGPAPDGMSIDRINNDGNYEPGNCRWATPKEQANNTRTVRLVEWKGDLYTVSKLSELVGVSRKRILQRISDGWPIDKVVQPPMMRGRAVTKAKRG